MSIDEKVFEEQLTCKGESPEIADVDEPDEQCKANHGPTFEQHAIAYELELELLHQRKIALLVTRAEQFSAALSRIIICRQCLEILQGDTALALINLGHMLQDLNSLLILTTIHEVLRRLLEVEDDESQEEDEQRDGTESEHQIAPSHIVRFPAARLTLSNNVAGGQLEPSIWVGNSEVGSARVVGNEAICYSTADGDTDRLEDREKRKHEALVLRNEFKADGGVDGDVATNAESIEGGDHKEGAIRAAAAKTETKGS